MKTANQTSATARPISGAWITQPSQERNGAAMIVDSATESYVIADELGYDEAQMICREHNAHAALVEACEFALKFAEAQRKETGDAIPGGVCSSLRNALTLARGEF